jgi:hypothetical protein
MSDTPDLGGGCVLLRDDRQHVGSGRQRMGLSPRTRTPAASTSIRGGRDFMSSSTRTNGIELQVLLAVAVPHSPAPYRLIKFLKYTVQEVEVEAGLHAHHRMPILSSFPGALYLDLWKATLSRTAGLCCFYRHCPRRDDNLFAPLFMSELQAQQAWPEEERKQRTG